MKTVLRHESFPIRLMAPLERKSRGDWLRGSGYLQVRQIACSVHDSRNANPVRSGPVNDEILAIRKCANIPTELWALSAHQGLLGELLREGLKFGDEPIRRINSVRGDLNPDVRKITLGQCRDCRIPQLLAALSAASFTRPACVTRPTAATSKGRDFPASS